MIVKEIRLREDIRCSNCSAKLKVGRKCIAIYDHNDVAYNDKYYCGVRCRAFDEYVDRYTLTLEEAGV